jgi:two-component system LytT family response regulator
MSKLRTLIVDDEPLARDRVRAFLQAEEGVEIVGECGSGLEALEVIRRERPDVVFLDMQMPGCDGLQVAAQLPAENPPVVIFVTAHEQFAVDAFAVRATDYLLKPFDQERFRAALRRAEETVRTRRASDLGSRLEGLIAGATPRAPGAVARRAERLAFKADGRVVLVRLEEIVWVEAADNYVVLHLANGERLTVRETLSALEERLGADRFARVNRSAVVAIDQVKELEPTFHGDYVVILRNGTRVPLSRSLRGRLREFFGDAG